MTEQATLDKLRAAFDRSLGPFNADSEIVKAITPPGGNWSVDAENEMVIWNDQTIAIVDPFGSLDENTADQVLMGIRAQPVADAALRTIIALCGDRDNMPLIQQLAEAVVAYIEEKLPARDDLGPDPLGDWHGRNE